MWLQCIGAVSGCCCKEVYRLDILTIIINFPYSTCISSFLAAASLLLCSFLKCFFRSLRERLSERLRKRLRERLSERLPKRLRERLSERLRKRLKRTFE